MGDMRSRALFAGAAKHSTVLGKGRDSKRVGFQPLYFSILSRTYSVPYLVIFNKSLKLLSVHPGACSSRHVLVGMLGA